MFFFGNIRNAKGKVHINKAWCKGCGYCVKYCPTNVLALSKDYNAKGYHPPEATKMEDCRNCKFCEVICPEFAIFVTDDIDEKE